MFTTSPPSERLIQKDRDRHLTRRGGYTRDYEETLLWFARLPGCAEIREHRCVHIA
jgi:hypothetical protein